MEKNNSEEKKIVSVNFKEITLKENTEGKTESKTPRKEPKPINRVVKLAPPEQKVTLPVMPPEYNKKVHGKIVKE